ncbi:fatty acid synthase-like [Papilio machaon]|uniref:fatty acid synthase-like n=1 Tax=Papilio machaon TaxID=76193 RepID=UPI001E66412F|nr:fatty acid synthase-like [Papilio machaon]
MHIEGDRTGDGRSLPTGEGSGMPTGDEIVISGISGKFPMSQNVTEFMENLYNKIDMVINIEPEIHHPEYPKHRGKVDDMEKFDATFFKVTYKQVLSLDNKCRQLMSYAYTAVYDSGVNPLQMKDNKLGVFIASSTVGDKHLLSDDYTGFKSTNNFFISGCSKAMYSNRISYWFNSKGPSYYIDCGCVGSLAVVDLACQSILSGDCEAALVGGCSICFSSTVTINLNNAGLLCNDGKTKCFDKQADGYVRSESIGFLFLQKAKDAKRIYAEICHTKLGYCSSPLSDWKIVRHANSKDITEFLKKFYSEIDVSPQEIEYVEANGIANAEDDKNELEAVGEMFGNKERPVKIGCVKSNMGNSESASGLCALTKVCLAYRKGEISGNLHYENPRDDVDAVRDRRIEVVHENTPFKRGFAALNSFSYTGLMAHVLLKGYYKEKNHKKYISNIPYLVNVSSRNEAGVGRMLDILAATPIDAEYIGLLHNIHKIETPGHNGRGYIILRSNLEEKTCVLSKSVQLYTGIKPPVCFMYSGMGSQWCEMGADLMNIPIFSAAIKKCHKVLEPKGVNIIDILTLKDQTIYDDIMNCFVGITAVQIGLTDILRALEIVPDYIIGHSTGEVGCAYADGCLTLEETILSAYCRGLASKQTEVIRGAMAAVGMGYDDLKRICPADIEIACHNSAGSSTISGPVDILKDFVALLTSRGIFAKEVPCGNIAYHSKYVAAVGPPLFEALKEVLKNPKKRTSKWLSTSFLKTRWDEDIAKFSSAEYFTNNLMSPVYFEETSKLIPNNAVVIEIAPHGLLQAIVKRSHKSCEHVPLARRGHENPTNFLLDAIGRLYQSGLNPQIHELYPKIEYPVATDTPLLSNLVGWEHSENWPIFIEAKKIRKQGQICNYFITLYGDENKFINGYTRNGVNVIPEALLLVLTWKTLAMARNVDHNQMSVKFNNVYFNHEVSFEENKLAKITVSINKGDYKFEVSNYGRRHKNIKVEQHLLYELVTNYDTVVVTGHITDESPTNKCNFEPNNENSEDDIFLTSDEIYRLLGFRGYSFKCGGVTIKDMVFSDRAVVHTQVPSVLLVRKNSPQVLEEFSGDDIISGQWGSHYYTPVSSHDEVEEFKVTLKNPKDLESVSFEEIATPKSLTNKIIKVCYAGVSQRDYQQSMFGTKLDLGMDFSGKDFNGEQVMGLLAQGSLSSSVAPDPELVWPVPRHWTLQEAATVPLPYVHAYYVLSKANLINGDRVLIIGGAGALGQALISVCLSLGCIVYTTVSTLRKKEALLKLFSNLKENNVICELNDEVLYDHIVTQTDNQLCKVVVSCASGRLREVAMKCVGFTGTFLDVNQKDMESNKSFGMSFMWQCRTYKIVDLFSLFERNNNMEKQALQFIVAEGIANGVVKPLPSITYDIEEVPRALKLLSSRNNIGRVLIKMDLPPKKNLVPRITCSSTATYLVVCTEVVLSLELIELLISRGARNIIVLWDGSAKAYFLYKIRYFEKSYSSVNIVIKNVINDKECTNAIKEAEKVGSLEGVFLIVGKDVKQCDDVSEEQILLTRNKTLMSMISSLDFATRSLSQNLRYFVIVSESSRNIYDKEIYLKAENICKERQTIGLPGLAFEAEISNELSKYFNSKDNIVAEIIPEVLSALERSLNLNYHYIKAVIGPCNETGSLETERKEFDPKTTTVDPKIVDGSERRVKGKDLSEFSFTNGNGDSMAEKNNGFGVFYSYIESDVNEITAHALVRMSTKAYEYFENKFEIDPSVTHLILIPGFEGHHKIFKDLCEPLKLRAVAMKLDTDLNSSSIQNMALNIYKTLSRNLNFKKTFYLLGYSFGVNVALELAALIEKQGERGIVFCLDSSPDALKHLMKTYAGDLSNTNLQNVIAARMFHLTTGLNSEEFLKELETIESWDKKIDAFIRRVKGLVPYSHEYMRSLLEITYNRVISAREYQPNLKLKSELVLIKSTTSAEFVNLPDDYNLGKYSESPVKVYDIDGDHASVPYDIRVSTIINDSLEAKLLNEFNKTNTCETYLMKD